MINLKRLKMMRSAARVARFHTMPTLHTQSVGEHTFGAMAILMEVCEPNAFMIRALLYHDSSEVITGDVPSTAKWLRPALEEELKLIEGVVEDRFCTGHGGLSEDERRILKFCDLMEGALFCLEELSMGNRLTAVIARDYLAAIEKRGLTKVTEKAGTLFTHVSLYANTLDVPALAGGHYLHGRVEL